MSEMDAMFGEDESETQGSTVQVENVRPILSGVLQFHTGTEEALYLYVRQNAQEGDSASVLKAIDTFCYTRHWMMHIGDEKLSFLYSAIDEMKSLITKEGRIAVELGSYCGYSAVSIAARLDTSNGDMLYCVESEPQCVYWTHRMVAFAGLQDRVKVLQYAASDVEHWMLELPSSRIDLLFIDHDKKEYLRDLQRIEQAGLLGENSVVVADNVLCFNAPLTAYMDYVRDTSPEGRYKSSRLHTGTIEYATTEEERQNVDGIEISVHR